jgi:hypothetical protein
MLFGACCVYVSSVDSDAVLTGPLVALAFLLLPLLVLLSIPVPVPEDACEPMPMWFAMLYLGIPIAAPIMAIGMGARAAWNHWRSHAVA